MTYGESVIMGHAQNLRFVVSAKVSNAAKTLIKP